MPPVPGSGVPLNTPFGLNATPFGSVPATLNVGAGNPFAARSNEPAVPTVKVALLRLVIAGASSTMSVKLWLAAGLTPLVAVNVRSYVPPVPVAGIPLNTPVEALKETPMGSAPDSLRLGAGIPIAVTSNVPAVPTTNVALLALVITGALTTDKV